MNNAALRHHATAPLWYRLIAYIAVAGTLFYIFHTVILFIFSATLEPAVWVQELYFNIFVGMPVFLFARGEMISRKSYKYPSLIFMGIAILGYGANFLNAYEVIDVSGLQWPTSFALLGLLITYLIHFITKKKSLTDYLKLAWFACIFWVFIAKRFVPHGGYAGWFLIAAQVIYPFMMIAGLLHFFKSPKNENHESSTHLVR
ncbi:MAG: hypothetical protein L6Q81_12475 [Bacteroidia bacterium]|nr:hypothetical protein [Bacteroidia bacterium]